MSDTKPFVEVRPNLCDETIDEIVARDVDVHIEQMSDGCFWIGISRGDLWWSGTLSTRRGAAIDFREQDGIGDGDD